MTEIRTTKVFDLEERTFVFARTCREFVSKIPRTSVRYEDARQLIRSSGSIGANYIEANEALSKKDFAMRLKIARKEAKETIFWLRLTEAPDKLIVEAMEIKKILSAIIDKSQSVS